MANKSYIIISSGSSRRRRRGRRQMDVGPKVLAVWREGCDSTGIHLRSRGGR